MPERLKGQSRPLFEIIRLLDLKSAASVIPAGLALLLSLVAPAALCLYILGRLEAEPAIAFFLLGWLFISGSEFPAQLSNGSGRPSMSFIVLRSLDAGLVIALGLFLYLERGLPETVLAWAVAASLTLYLGYYSGISLLKAVPGKIRLAMPEAMVAADHLFLSRGTVWGGEREIVLFLSAAGVVIGRPEWGFAASVTAGNLNWIIKALYFWRRTKKDER